MLRALEFRTIITFWWGDSEQGVLARDSLLLDPVSEAEAR
jgi:hypothetical protein